VTYEPNVLRHEATARSDLLRRAIWAHVVIWRESGGSGDRTILFLHGLGATAAVWTGARQALEERGGCRWVMVDLIGHGGSDPEPFYSVGQLAAQLAQTIRLEPAPLIVGHSLGAYVGLALASGWFGVRIRAVLGIGPKIAWPEADLKAARDLAARPVRCYATEDEALTRYRRVSGLGEEMAPGREVLARGVLRTPDGWRLAQDPGTFAVAGASFASLASAAQARVILARGERDPMVSLEELRAHAHPAYDIRGAGHNAHVEDSRAVLGLIERLLSAD
jgi:pimeloyl-ACP methyl ester carboxylesterase